MQTKKLKLVDMDKKLGEAFDVLSEQAKGKLEDFVSMILFAKRFKNHSECLHFRFVFG